MKRHTLTAMLPIIPGNNSKVLRQAVRSGTVEGMAGALVRRAHEKPSQRVKKTMSTDLETALRLQNLAQSVQLSLEETARLVIEQYLFEHQNVVETVEN